MNRRGGRLQRRFDTNTVAPHSSVLDTRLRLPSSYQPFKIPTARSAIRVLELRKIDDGRAGDTSGTAVVVDINLGLNRGGKRMGHGSESSPGGLGV